MSRKVHLARGLSVPAEELATQVVAALGMRGSGKSNIMAVIVEGLLSADVQVIILDYVGIWFSLRLDSSGKRPSPYAIPVLGGKHGDIGLVPAAGKDVAKALAESGSPAVLDVSGFSKTARCTFATDLAEALFAAKKDHPSPTFLVLEEAQRFIPQKLFSGQERMLGAFEEIAEVGRNYGLGLGMISQRPQKLNKDVLNLTELLLAFQANGVLERKAIAEWVQEKDAEGRKEVNNELPQLERGEALVWSPSWLRVYGRYHTDKKTTYDAGATPIKARAAVKVRPLDLQSLETAMAAVVDQAKADDPKALRAELARLKAELARASSKAPAAKPAPSPPAVPARMLRALGDLRKKLDRLAAGLADAGTELYDLIKAESKAPAPAEVPRGDNGTHPKVRPYVAPVPRLRELPAVGGDAGQLGKASRSLLTALAQLGGRGSDAQISILSGYSAGSGTFSNALGALRTAGLIEYGDGERLLTEAGREATRDVPPAPSGAELLDFWCTKLGKAARTFLRTVWEQGPLTHEALAEATGYSAGSGTFSNALGQLRSANLVNAPRGQNSVAVAEMFHR